MGSGQRNVRILFHAAAAASYGYACYYDWNYVILPPELNVSPFGNKLKFLTYWDALLQTAFFTVCLLNDLMGCEAGDRRQRNPSLRKFRDYLFTLLAFPLAMFVGLTFWGLMAVNRELVLPSVLDKVFPRWLNHVVHTNIMFTVLVEMLTSQRTYPAISTGVKTLLTVFGAYLIWLHVIYYKTGRWVYPVFAVLNLPVRLVFFVALLCLGVAIFVVGEKINSLRWPKAKSKGT